MLEAFPEVDVDLAKLSGDISAFRLSESRAFLEAMNQEMASTVFYGNASANPEEFNGLSIRYSSLSAANARNIINANGAGSDNTSVWLVVWGDMSCFGVFPKGSKAGIMHEDLNIETVENVGGVTGARMRAYRDHYQWKNGLVLKDWRQVGRVCNIDVSNLVSGASAADLTKLMIKLMHRIENLKLGKACWYMNRTVFTYLDLQRRDDVITGGGITYANVDGEIRPTFRGVPIAVCDAILDTEATVS
jgi:hypothetical protein